MNIDASGVPRRNRLDLNTPAELAIRAAVHAVEAAGCDPRLTDIVNELTHARERLADFVDRAVSLDTGGRGVPPVDGCDCNGHRIGYDGNYVPHDPDCRSLPAKP